MASVFSYPAIIKCSRRDAVYVGAVPLRAPKGPSQLLISAAYSLNLWWDLRHYLVYIRPTSPHAEAMVFDFQPLEPENPYVALAALLGRPVPGVVLQRKFTRIPSQRCCFVGFSSKECIEVACKFNKSWQTDLKIGEHDCRHYTNGLVEHLTGERNILDRLKGRLRY